MFEHLVLTRPLAIFDLETTGTSPERDRIVEISVVKALPGGGVETKTRRVNPGMPHFRQLAKGLLEFLDGCDLCGFNIRRFDLPFLNAEFRRSGLEFSVQGRAVVDAMEIFHAEEPRSLTGAVKFYLEKTHEGAHGAEADAVATARVLDAMAARYPHLPSGVEALDKKMRFPNQMDVAGNFESVRGKPRFTFGKHEGKFLADVVRDDPGYLSWVLNGGFLDDTKAIIRQAMQPDLFSAPGE